MCIDFQCQKILVVLRLFLFFQLIPVKYIFWLHLNFFLLHFFIVFHLVIHAAGDWHRLNALVNKRFGVRAIVIRWIDMRKYQIHHAYRASHFFMEMFQINQTLSCRARLVVIFLIEILGNLKWIIEIYNWFVFEFDCKLHCHTWQSDVYLSVK